MATHAKIIHSTPPTPRIIFIALSSLCLSRRDTKLVLLLKVCRSSIGNAFDVAGRSPNHDWDLTQLTRTCFAPIDDEANRLVRRVALIWLGHFNYWQIALLALPPNDVDIDVERRSVHNCFSRMIFGNGVDLWWVRAHSKNEHIRRTGIFDAHVLVGIHAKFLRSPTPAVARAPSDPKR